MPMGQRDRSQVGINQHGTPGVCMVVGCARKALYRTGAGRNSKDRGYCRDHRHFAIRQGTTAETSLGNAMEYFSRPWRGSDA